MIGIIVGAIAGGLLSLLAYAREGDMAATAQGLVYIALFLTVKYLKEVYRWAHCQNTNCHRLLR